MTEYARNASVERGASSRSTVGRDLESSMQMTFSHPRYVAQSEYADKLLEERLTKEAEKKANAKQAVCTLALDASVRETLVQDFPEFRIVWARMGDRVHPVFSARRQLINQLMTHMAGNYASSYVHYGGTALSYMTAGIQSVHLQVDPSSTVAMGINYHDAVDCTQVMSSIATAAASANWYFKSDTRKLYATRQAWLSCDKGELCQHAAEALIVDGSIYNMSTTQFMFAMQQHHSQIGYFALPYDSQMMVSDAGVITDTGIMYEVAGTSIRFKYPDGVVGVNFYQPDSWHDWLTNSERCLSGLRSNYQFEMFDERPGFQIIRVIEVAKRKVPKQRVYHSLQLAGRKDKTLVTAWRLKDLISKPHGKDSWEQVSVLMPTDAVEKTYEYAMAMPPEDFSRVNIRKRLEVYNDRVIVEGQKVVVRSPLTVEQINVTEVAIFVTAFVRRFEANKLAAGLMRVLNDKLRFGDYPSLFVRYYIAMYFVTDSMFSIAYRFVDDTIRIALDKIIDWFRGDGVRVDTTFTPAPQFIRIDSAVSLCGRSYVDKLRSIISSPSSVVSACSGAAGYAQAVMFGVGGVQQTEDFMVRVDTSAFGYRSGGSIFSDVLDTSLPGGPTEAGSKLYSQMRSLNEFDEADDSRHMMGKQWVESDTKDIDRRDYALDPGFIDTINEAHEAVFPGMRQPDFHYDTAIMAINDQHRNFTTEYLAMSTEMNAIPSKQRVYLSKIHAYSTAKRRNVVQEVLSAIEARNLAAPIVAIPQNDEVMIKLVWENFLDMMCVPDARSRLAKYQTDPVGLEKQAVQDWTLKARPDNLAKVIKYVADNPESWEEMRVDEYNAMIKSDVKPPLSDKPLNSYLAPQVIVHHKPVINAVFSSVLRVLVRRFESILKPNVYVNLLKDMPYIRDVMQVNHKWSSTSHYLENDFSKYDKSQHRFVFLLETYIYEQLGMNQDMLSKWELGHVDCKIKAMNVGLSLHVRYQRKSGDAGTAFANGLVNCVSVAWAYQGTQIDWAVFIGDDSLVCTDKVVGSARAVAALAETFNLLAKYYDTPAPYFASNFIVINNREKRITAVPDPFKRAEKFSMSVPADDPKWKERYVSAVQALEPYLRRGDVAGLAEMIPQRYNTKGYNMQALIDAIATSVSSYDRFRSMWEDKPTELTF